MSGFDNEVVYADGIDLSGGSPVSNKLATDGFLYIGSGSTNPVAALPTSTDGSISYTAGAGSLDLSVDTTGIPTLATTYTTDSGNATPAANVLTVSGGTGMDTSASGSTVTVTLETPVVVANGGTGAVTLTDGGIVLGSGTGAVTVTSQPTNGQLLIGSTGVDPVLGTLTDPAAGITITEGAGSITFALADDLSAVEGLGTTGLVSRTAADTWTTTSVTDNAIIIGDASEVVQMVGPLTNGQLLIGSTGATPVAASLASADSSVTITGGAGTIDLSVSPASFDSVGVYNLGFDYNGGTGVFSITSADGSALSATNIGYVTIWSREASDPGTLVTIPITSNVSFIDDVGASEIIGNLFGTVTGVAYGNDLPFWIHAVLNNDEDAIAFCLTRNAFGLTSPAAADIGAPDDAVADEQNDYWSFDNIDETLYDLNPSMPIGVIAMQKSAADDWTVQGLYASSSGVNFPNGFLGLGFSENYTGLAGSFAAATGSFLLDNGGTAPTFTNQEMKYKYLGPQSMRVVFNFNGNTATDGAGAVNTKIMIPYTGSTTLNGLATIVGTGYVDCPAYTGMVMFEMSGNEQFIQIRDINGNYFQNEDFADGDRTIEGSIVYITGDNP